MQNIDSKIMQLIEEKRGDLFRLTDMLERMRLGKELYNSDKKYIDQFFPESTEAETIVIVEKSKPKKVKSRRLLKKRAVIITVSMLILFSLVVIALIQNSPSDTECTNLFDNYRMIGSCILEMVETGSIDRISDEISSFVPEDIVDKLSNLF